MNAPRLCFDPARFASSTAHTWSTLRLCLLGVWLLAAGCSAWAEGIPEPNLVLYGEVRNATDGSRVTRGTLAWTFKPAGGGQTIHANVELTNVLGQFSYVLFLPCETKLATETTPTNTVPLTTLNASFDRSQVTVEGLAAQLVAPASYQWVLSSKDRGRVERVDLLINQSSTDSDNDGLPDWWELQYFGSLAPQPGDDPDGDGLTNLEEYLNGTDPTHFSIVVTVAETIQAQPQLKWNSVAGRTYTVLRATNLTQKLAGFVPLKSAVLANPPRNIFVDTDSASSPQSFYLIQVDP